MLGESLIDALSKSSVEVVTVGRSRSDDIALDLGHPMLDPTTQFRADVIFHCAAAFAADTPEGIRENMRVNAGSALDVDQLADRLGAGTVVFAGSTSSYSMSDTFLPETSYGLSKAIAEQSLRWSSSRSGRRFASLRFPALYDTAGRCCRHQQWFGRIIAYASRGLILRMPPGAAARNFVHVNDAASAMLQIASEDISGVHELVHDEMFSYREIAKLAYHTFDAGGVVSVDLAKPPFRDVPWPVSSLPHISRRFVALAAGIEGIKEAGTHVAFGPIDVS